MQHTNYQNVFASAAVEQDGGSVQGLPDRIAGLPYRVWKRVVDFVFSAAGLAVFAPLMLVIGAIIRLRSGTPVIIAQERIGAAGRPFLLYKFRSLPAAALAFSDREWTAQPADGWGRFLRETGFDELPQLWNVLRGDMSLVGPRPERPYFVAQFLRKWPVYSERHWVAAGITGWAQVHGWRGDTSIAQRLEYDLYYLRHWSLGLDFRILWMTLKELARRLGHSTTRGGPNDRRI